MLSNQNVKPQKGVLLVEDEKHMLRLLTKKFSEHGYTVFAAGDGDEAIKTYCRHKTEIAAVLLDIGLPKVKGVDVFYRMKRENPGVRVVISSGFLDPALRTEMNRAGVEQFIEKPYSVDELVTTFQSLIGRA